jgi:hypothetical protein
VISFRYHLVSIVAVLFALAIGIVVGSGFLGGPLRRQIDRELEQLGESNRQLRNAAVSYERFAETVEEPLTGSALFGETVVLFTVEGTNGGMVDELRGAIERAGGEIALTVTAQAKLDLATSEERAELGELLGSDTGAADDLRRELGTVLGTRAAAAAATAPPPPRLGATPDQRFEEMAEMLAGTDFIALDDLQAGDAVPSGAVFLIAAGSSDPAPFSTLGMFKALALGLSERGAGVLCAEPSDSLWGVVSAMRDDGQATDRVSTVDDAESIPGRIAVVLALDQAARGGVGHYGRGEGTTALPEPTPAG